MSRPRLLAASSRPLPISVRLGATFAAVFLVVLAGLSTLAYWGLGSSLRAEVDRTLVAAAKTLADAGSGSEDIDEHELGGVESPEFETQVMDVDGRVIGGSGDERSAGPLLSVAQVATARHEGALFVDVVDDGEPHRALAVPLDEAGDRVLVVVAELEDVREAQAGLLRWAVILSSLAGLLAGVAGWSVARQGLRPIDRMTAQAEAMGPHGPLPRDVGPHGPLRLPVPPSRDEVGRLGTTLNGLLDRIEDARRREREFTADASHELRTPLAILRAELELARSAAGDDRLGRALDSALEEADRLGHLVDDLLLLARADAGHVSPRALVDVGEVTDGLMPGFGTLAQRRGITLTRTGDAVVRADARALARAVANLLDNALRYAPEGGNVSLTVGQSSTGTAITVTDDGPGVPREERARLFERFTQVERSKPGGGGAGLGLAIVASVAAAHHGRVEITDAPSGQGLSVTLHLPLASSGSVLA